MMASMRLHMIIALGDDQSWAVDVHEAKQTARQDAELVCRGVLTQSAGLVVVRKVNAQLSSVAWSRHLQQHQQSLVQLV